MVNPSLMGAAQLARSITAGHISSRELLEYYLNRIDKFNSQINAIVVDLRSEALKVAEDNHRSGGARQAFGGVPITVKESFNVAGAPTTWGNPEWKSNIAKEDAVAVSRLKAIGANVFGKTNVPISLADFQSYNDVYGTTGNPFDLTRTPGGSSGGSAAALAAGLTGFEMGSDIGGSIRNPAHFCGVFGHKPTRNLLWMRGHSGPGDVRATPDISVIGPLARTAEDLDIAVRTLAGPDDISARGFKLSLPTLEGKDVRELKVAVWSDDDACRVSTEVRTRVENTARCLKDLGAKVDMDARPDFSAKQSHDTYEYLLQATMASRMPDESYVSLRDYVSKLDAEDHSRAANIFRAQVASFREWSNANEARHQLRWRWHEFFQQYDLLITPIMPTAAFPHDHSPYGQRKILVNGEERPYFEQVFWAGLTGVSYLPSTVVPTGLNDEGLPIGVQIIGAEYSDLITIGVAAALEREGFNFVPPPNYPS